MVVAAMVALPGLVEIYDTFGDAKGKARLNRGIQRVEIPHGGYALMRKGR